MATHRSIDSGGLKPVGLSTVKQREVNTMNVPWRWMAVAALAVTLVACGQEKSEEKPAATPDSLITLHDTAELSRIAVQEDAIGTAYGNMLKVADLIGAGEIKQARQVAVATRYLLLAYVDSIEKSQLPRLEERAKSAIYHLDRIMFYLDNSQTDKAMEHVDLCKIHLNSLRQLTGLKRVM